MVASRGYQQFCPTAAALNAIGDRWALLVVRDILTSRLRELEAADVIRRRGEGRARRYDLTPSGRALRPVLVELARWGADRLQLPADPDEILPRVALTSLLLDPPPLPTSIAGGFEIRCDPETARFTIYDGDLTIDDEAAVTTTIDLTPPGVRALLIGSRVKQLRASGDVSIDGDTRTATTLLNKLAAPPLLDGLRRRYLADRAPTN